MKMSICGLCALISLDADVRPPCIGKFCEIIVPSLLRLLKEVNLGLLEGWYSRFKGDFSIFRFNTISTTTIKVICCHSSMALSKGNFKKFVENFEKIEIFSRLM